MTAHKPFVIVGMPRTGSTLLLTTIQQHPAVLSYSELFHQYEASPLLIVNNEHFNVADSDDAFNLLLERIEKMRGQREYFNPNLT